MFKYILKRSQRKTLSLYIKQNQLIVKAPLNLPIEIIENFIEKKYNWIVKHLEKSQSSIFNIEIDNKIPYMGGMIKIVEGKELAFDGINLSINKNFDIKKQVIKWYKQQASIIVQELITVWQQKMQLFPSEVVISNGKSRLGYCTNFKKIAISWYLVLQPIYVIEYVVIHELAHIKHFNHSLEFWQLVQYYCKNYEKAMNFLKNNNLNTI